MAGFALPNLSAVPKQPQVPGANASVIGSGSFNLSPAPAAGASAYGSVPGQLGLPNSTYSEASNVIPGLPQLTGSAGDVVGSELKGEISPGTVNFLQDKAAQFGVSMGMPGLQPGSFNSNNLVRSLGLTSEALSQQGVKDYGGLLGTVASTQITPELQNEIATQNALWASAPDPSAAAHQQISDLKDLYALGKSPAGGTKPAVIGGWENGVWNPNAKFYA